MERFIIKGSMCVLLAWNAALDFRKREVSLRSLAVFAAAGIVINLWLKYQSIWLLLGGVGVGVFLLLTAFVTKEAVGIGDGLLLCVTGIYLGFWENLRLLCTGLVFCVLFLGAGLVLRRLRRTDRFPLVPFLLLAWIGRLFL